MLLKTRYISKAIVSVTKAIGQVSGAEWCHLSIIFLHVESHGVFAFKVALINMFYTMNEPVMSNA